MHRTRSRRAGDVLRWVADALGIKQPSLSKLEKQSDMQISTLRRIVNALGGELEVSARFPAGTIKIEPFNESGSGKAVSPQASKPGRISMRK